MTDPWTRSPDDAGEPLAEASGGGAFLDTYYDSDGSEPSPLGAEAPDRT